MSNPRFVPAGLSILVHAALLGVVTLGFTQPRLITGDHDRVRKHLVTHRFGHEAPAPHTRSTPVPRKTTAPRQQPRTRPAATPPVLRIARAHRRETQPIPTRLDLAPPEPRPALAPALASASPAARPDATGEQGPASSNADTATRAAGGAQGPRPRKDATNRYAGLVHRHISRYKGFPRELARKGIEGTVLTRLTLAPGGRLDTIELVQSSGFALLDRLALEQIRLAAPFPRPPEALRARYLSFLVPMAYGVRG